MNFHIDIEIDIGNQMKYILKECNLSQKEVANDMDVPASLLSYYVNNKRPQNVEIICKFLNSCRKLKK